MMKQETIEEAPSRTQRQDSAENIWLNLSFNIALPLILLRKGSDWFPALSPGAVLAIALLFPAGYFLYDVWRRRNYNFLSILGFAGVLLTGGIGLLRLNPFWIAVKEAIIPLMIGIAIAASMKTRFPLVRKMLFNGRIMDLPKVDRAIAERGAGQQLENLLATCSWLLAGSFFFSGGLNFILARIIVTTHPAIDAVAFNHEISRLTLLSWPVIVAPSTAIMVFTLWKLLTGIKQLTGLDIEEVLLKK